MVLIADRSIVPRIMRKVKVLEGLSFRKINILQNFDVVTLFLAANERYLVRQV